MLELINRALGAFNKKNGVRERGIFKRTLVIYGEDTVINLSQEQQANMRAKVIKNEDNFSVRVQLADEDYTIDGLTQQEARNLVHGIKNRLSGKWGIGRWALAVVVVSFLISGNNKGVTSVGQVHPATGMPAAAQMEPSGMMPSMPVALGAPVNNATFGLPESTFGK